MRRRMDSSDLDPSLIHALIGSHESAVKRHLDRFNRFCTAHEREQPTCRHTHTHTHTQQAQLSPRDPRDALCQLKCWPTVVRIGLTQTDHVSNWGSFSATATFCCATCIALYMHRCSRLNYCTASMRCSVSHTCNAEVTVGVINRLPYNQLC